MAQAVAPTTETGSRRTTLAVTNRGGRDALLASLEELSGVFLAEIARNEVATSLRKVEHGE